MGGEWPSNDQNKTTWQMEDSIIHATTRPLQRKFLIIQSGKQWILSWISPAHPHENLFPAGSVSLERKMGTPTEQGRHNSRAAAEGLAHLVK
jgi:hypothetical protein